MNYDYTIFLYIYYAGPTEKKILANMESIIESAMPLEELSQFYQESPPDSASAVILKYIAYYEDLKKVKNHTYNISI